MYTAFCEDFYSFSISDHEDILVYFTIYFINTNGFAFMIFPIFIPYCLFIVFGIKKLIDLIAILLKLNHHQFAESAKKFLIYLLTHQALVCFYSFIIQIVKHRVNLILEPNDDVIIYKIIKYIYEMNQLHFYHLINITLISFLIIDGFDYLCKLRNSLISKYSE
jgi:hypothetical protein